IDHVRDPAIPVRTAAVSALGSSGSPEATAPVVGALNDSSHEVRFTAAGALLALVERPGGASIKDAALSPLIRALDDPESQVTWWAVIALQRYGPAGAPALPALRRILLLADPFLTSPVEDAIKAIEA